jgi:hypothetical protein
MCSQVKSYKHTPARARTEQLEELCAGVGVEGGQHSLPHKRRAILLGDLTQDE